MEITQRAIVIWIWKVRRRNRLEVWMGARKRVCGVRKDLKSTHS